MGITNSSWAADADAKEMRRAPELWIADPEGFPSEYMKRPRNVLNADNESRRLDDLLQQEYEAGRVGESGRIRGRGATQQAQRRTGALASAADPTPNAIAGACMCA